MLAPQTPRRERRAPPPLGGLALALLICLMLTACGAATAQRQVSGAGENAPGRTLVVLGASDAFGIGSFDPDRENWPTRLAEDLPQPVHLVNLGIPGATLEQAQQEELPIAIAQRPQIVVIWLAVNDIIDETPLDAYTANLRATLATFRTESPQTRVFVGNVPDLSLLPFFAGDNPVALRAEDAAWNAAIAHACVDEGATLVDLASGWGQFDEHPDYISSDGLHPSALGALELASFFDAVIRQTLKITG